MTQARSTTCAHNAPGQTLIAGHPIVCRQCGAQIQPTPRAVNAAGQLLGREKATNAAYPGDANTSDTAWAFAQ